VGAQPLTDDLTIIRRLFRKAVQQGRSKRRGESYSLPYVEPLSAARTPLEDVVNSLLDIRRPLLPGCVSIGSARDITNKELA